MVYRYNVWVVPYLKLITPAPPIARVYSHGNSDEKEYCSPRHLRIWTDLPFCYFMQAAEFGLRRKHAPSSLSQGSRVAGSLHLWLHMIVVAGERKENLDDQSLLNPQVKTLSLPITLDGQHLYRTESRSVVSNPVLYSRRSGFRF
jgi:hypothetical protein